jgi:hypothetical protein
MREKCKMNKCYGKLIYQDKHKTEKGYDLFLQKEIKTKRYSYKCNKCNNSLFKDYPPNQDRDIYKCLERF